MPVLSLGAYPNEQFNQVAEVLLDTGCFMGRWLPTDELKKSISTDKYRAVLLILNMLHEGIVDILGDGEFLSLSKKGYERYLPYYLTSKMINNNSPRVEVTANLLETAAQVDTAEFEERMGYG